MESQLYREHILDHANHPRNRGALPGADLAAEAENPNCGDHLKLYVKTADGRIEKAAFEGEGCALSIAGASMLTERLRDMPLKDAKLLTPGDVYALFQVQISMTRSQCALLAYQALEGALSHGS